MRATVPAVPATIGFDAIKPTQLYTFAEVAALFRRKRTVVYDWVKDGKIVPVAGVRMFLGAEIMRFAGLTPDQVRQAKSETRAERTRRAKESRERIRDMARTPRGSGSR